MKHERKEVFQAATAAEELDFSRVFQLLRAGIWWIFGAAFIGGVLGVVLAYSLPNKYQVVSVLAPATENTRPGGLSGIMGQLGGLASVAGISLPAGGGNSEVALATLQSPAFLAGFIHDAGIKPQLYPKLWDPDAKAWEPRPHPGPLKKMLLGLINDPMQISISEAPSMEPSDYAAALMFKEKLLTVSQDKRTELVTLTIAWRDSAQALQWSNELVRRLNARVRETMLNDSDKSIAYLRQQAQTTPEVEVRTAIYDLMQAKLKSRMVASVSEEVAFRYADKPLVPTVPSGPHRGLIVLGLMLLGATLAIAVILAREQLRSARA